MAVIAESCSQSAAPSVVLELRGTPAATQGEYEVLRAKLQEFGQVRLQPLVET